MRDKVKKILLFIVCAACLCFSRTEVQAEEGNYNGLIYHYAPHFYYGYYGRDDEPNTGVLYKEVIIVDYVGTDSVVTIPEEINGIPVTEVAAGCFAFNEQIQKVVFEGPYTLLGEEMFMGCKNLKEVLLPQQLREVPERAFAYCTGLETIRIPCEFRMDIDTEAFYKCTGLKKVFFGEEEDTYAGPIGVSKAAFKGCKNLKEISIYPMDYIGKDAFRDCKSLKEVRLETELVHDGAFANCTGLKKVVFVYGWADVKSKNTFYGCKNLKTIIFEKDPPEKIYPGTFKGIHKKAKFYTRYAYMKKLKKMLTKETGFKKTMKVKEW